MQNKFQWSTSWQGYGCATFVAKFNFNQTLTILRWIASFKSTGYFEFIERRWLLTFGGRKKPGGWVSFTFSPNYEIDLLFWPPNLPSHIIYWTYIYTHYVTQNKIIYIPVTNTSHKINSHKTRRSLRIAQCVVVLLHIICFTTNNWDTQFLHTHTHARTHAHT